MLLCLSLIIDKFTLILRLIKPNENCQTQICYFTYFQDGENMWVRRPLNVYYCQLTM